ncbi:histidinol dehydrogenase [Puniceicoccales bacterium CK1056]|uniref:Histidinol dehydrogenase n=1 Tax=Oceanipulchritudo coccoides TaxID=2706888 RepID=A0A6B2M4W4_9BACT|nr:histidinol dehydrogenase [Oceanipulchritudo coccoides]NDV62670.1 histidinol dehydrogenase [Oceanipulchritudo coccoides]
MKKLIASDPAFYRKLGQFAADEKQRGELEATVKEVLEQVRQRGDSAVLEYTRKFDGFRSTAQGLKVDPSSLKAAESALSPAQRKEIRSAIRCVRDFHKKGLPSNWMAKNPHGARVGERWYPISRVGIYIPAGNVPLVSTAVMTTTLARLAGVKSIAVSTPANREGKISQQMLAGLSLCGVSEVYRIGGAQAIAAMAFGTKTIEPVLKIMGPGNAYVAEAQRQVFGQVGIDLLPGPSEALAIADGTAKPHYLAADLLAQAEHGSGRERVYFVYTNEAQARKVEAEAERMIPTLGHAEAVRKIWKTRTCFIKVSNISQAIEVANFIAPEHLELHVDKVLLPRLLQDIQTAGAILCGHDTPTVIGDFTAGPSHTLPTSRTGRFFSGLKITDFMRRSSIVQYDQDSLKKARNGVRVFSELEALDAHGQSMEIRFPESS